jgi:hypothetical protein
MKKIIFLLFFLPSLVFSQVKDGKVFITVNGILMEQDEPTTIEGYRSILDTVISLYYNADNNYTEAINTMNEILNELQADITKTTEKAEEGIEITVSTEDILKEFESWYKKEQWKLHFGVGAGFDYSLQNEHSLKILGGIKLFNIFLLTGPTIKFNNTILHSDPLDFGFSFTLGYWF